VLGSIALQGIRLISPTIGETVVVSGLGLIGLLAIQILKANGCNVIGIDIDTKNVKLQKIWE
jgi:threonine dehydrogenase-like Zn-dependent dehydrogenase